MAFTWATRRRFWVLGSAAGIVLLLAAGVTIAVMYEAPTCTDGLQNQGEEGIDCGGGCPYLCRESVTPLRVVFARPITTTSGRTDVVAYVENRNQGAEVLRANYTVEVFDVANVLLGTREGSVPVPPRSVVPVFIPNLYVGTVPAYQAFLSFDENVRFQLSQGERSVPRIQDVTLATVENGSRVTAMVENPTVTALYNVKLVATLFDPEGNVRAASQTIVREVAPRSRSEAVFTWSTPFAETLRVEILVAP